MKCRGPDMESRPESFSSRRRSNEFVWDHARESPIHMIVVIIILEEQSGEKHPIFCIRVQEINIRNHKIFLGRKKKKKKERQEKEIKYLRLESRNQNPNNS